jgi:WD40 repeat protein
MRLTNGYYGSSVDGSPDGHTCLAALWIGTIRLFDCASGQPLRELAGHEDMIFAGAYFTADGRRIVSGSGDIFATPRDSSVRVWDVATGEQSYR